MSAHLEAVRIARDHRAQAAAELEPLERTFRRAIVRAAQHHSLRAIAPAAGMTHAGVKYIIDQEARAEQ